MDLTLPCHVLTLLPLQSQAPCTQQCRRWNKSSPPTRQKKCLFYCLQKPVNCTVSSTVSVDINECAVQGWVSAAITPCYTITPSHDSIHHESEGVYTIQTTKSTISQLSTVEASSHNVYELWTNQTQGKIHTERERISLFTTFSKLASLFIMCL